MCESEKGGRARKRGRVDKEFLSVQEGGRGRKRERVEG
jgi:hypothetical protein